MPSPTPRALAVAAAGLLPALPAVLGAAGAAQAWVAFWLVFLGAVAADVALCPPPRSLRLEVELPALLAVGASEPATLRLALPSRRPRAFGAILPAEVLVETSTHLETPEPRTAGLSATPVELVVELTARRRGEAAVEEVWVRWRGPLGLVRRSTRRRPRATVPVTPDLTTVGRRALEHVTSRQALPGRRIERYAGQGSEFHALRDWVAGLDRRAIDWKASARHTRLLARELRAERNHQIVLALDTGHLMAEPVDGLARLDHAIHAALLLAFVSLRHGDRVGLYAFGESPGVWAPPRGGRSALPALVRVAAGLEAGHGETNFTLGLTELSRRLRRRSLVVVLTDFVDSVTAGLMVDNVERLARRQLVLFVAFRDPLLAALMDRPPAERLDVDRAVVAASLERERRGVLTRLARRGVQVLDAAPAEVGPGLLDRYLAIKRREMI